HEDGTVEMPVDDAKCLISYGRISYGRTTLADGVLTKGVDAHVTSPGILTLGSPLGILIQVSGSLCPNRDNGRALLANVRHAGRNWNPVRSPTTWTACRSGRTTSSYGGSRVRIPFPPPLPGHPVILTIPEEAVAFRIVSQIN